MGSSKSMVIVTQGVGVVMSKGSGDLKCRKQITKANNEVKQSAQPPPVEMNHTWHNTTHFADSSAPAMPQVAYNLRHL